MKQVRNKVIVFCLLSCLVLAGSYSCGDDHPGPSRRGMEKIPAGCFNMGDAFSEGAADELPVHFVCVTSFLMDVHEVTNAEYMRCVDAGACSAPSDIDSWTRASYYGNPAYDDHPVIYITWDRADAYCAWAGKRLPTEAEWEYAARGGHDGARYPWGDETTCDDASYGRWNSSGVCWNYGGLENDTHPVMSYPANGYGLFDMAGNVMEWTSDAYGGTYYQYCKDNFILFNPPGPAYIDYYAVRGGSFGHEPTGTTSIRVSDRLLMIPDMAWVTYGIRCASY